QFAPGWGVPCEGHVRNADPARGQHRAGRRGPQYAAPGSADPARAVLLAGRPLPQVLERAGGYAQGRDQPWVGAGGQRRFSCLRDSSRVRFREVRQWHDSRRARHRSERGDQRSRAVSSPHTAIEQFTLRSLMRRGFLVVGMIACAAGPVAAQWLGEPVWNSPKGGTGLTISGDYAKPNSDYGKGNTWGGRAALGLGTLTVSVGVESWKPDLATKAITSFGGNADFRLIGGSLLPVAVNLQVGAARSDSTATSRPAATRVIGAVGISVPLPTPGLSVEPDSQPELKPLPLGRAVPGAPHFLIRESREPFLRRASVGARTGARLVRLRAHARQHAARRPGELGRPPDGGGGLGRPVSRDQTPRLSPGGAAPSVAAEPGGRAGGAGG